MPSSPHTEDFDADSSAVDANPQDSIRKAIVTVVRELSGKCSLADPANQLTELTRELASYDLSFYSFLPRVRPSSRYIVLSLGKEWDELNSLRQTCSVTDPNLVPLPKFTNSILTDCAAAILGTANDVLTGQRNLFRRDSPSCVLATTLQGRPSVLIGLGLGARKTRTKSVPLTVI